MNLLLTIASSASPRCSVAWSLARRVTWPWREATSRLDRYFTISIVDCSSTMDSPVTQEVLRDLDALIVVSSPWVDGAAAAGQTMDWLAARGLTGLLQRTVIVLNDSDARSDGRVRLNGDMGPEPVFVDLLDGTSYPRDGSQVAADGLFVSLPPHGAHLFRLEREAGTA